ncbi:MAG: hypothetical protein AB2448_01570 [Moorella sp. (in: firmicutes)]
MKLRVIKAFIDRHTGKPYNPGYVYETDDMERIKQLQEAGYLERVPLPLPEIEQAVIVPDEDARLPKKRQKKK